MGYAVSFVKKPPPRNSDSDYDITLQTGAFFAHQFHFSAKALIFLQVELFASAAYFPMVRVLSFGFAIKFKSSYSRERPRHPVHLPPPVSFYRAELFFHPSAMLPTPRLTT